MLTVESLTGYKPFWQKIIPFESNYLKYKLRGMEILDDSYQVDPTEWDIAAEYAFLLATRQYSDSDSLVLAREKILGLRRKAGEDVAEVHLSPRGQTASEVLGPHIRGEVEQLFDLAGLRWQPKVAGYGALLASEADAISDSCVIEIKNVDRLFQPKDVRQVLLYATALNGSGEFVNSFCLINPRKGISLKADLQTACLRMSGQPWISVRAEIEQFLVSLNSWFVNDL